ncbi:MAG: HIT domain-containing protein [Holosporales bacterium]|jgi:diadenosine tetraphosphate (Ap4A) HIT family hydrolase|nr:HIT domain-containing protein [Holosporales bacterium]
MSYDSNNIFAKIIRGEIPCEIVDESAFFISFYDLYPKAPIHVLVIPKGEFENAFSFHNDATQEQIYGFYQGLNQVIAKLDLNNIGFKLLSNNGVGGGQEIFHYHVHLLGGFENS